MITMLLGGLWHGAAWTFVLWGAFHGAGLSAEHALDGRLGRSVPGWLRWFVTFHLVVFGWILFRSPSLDQLRRASSRGCSRPGPATLWSRPGGAGAIVVVIGLQLLPERPLEGFAAADRAPAAAACSPPGSPSLILFVGATVPSQGVAPFIYFRF